MFLDLQMQVEHMMRAGRPLDDAEEIINDETLPLSDDERAALWLWAWSLLDKGQQHTMALRYLQSLEHMDYGG